MQRESTVNDYEKLGAFYLGKSFDLENNKQNDDLILYDSKDLTTHAVIIGMTGSGKTGLGIALLEEAAIDKIPVIAIDPKGDMGNCLLTFPDLAAADFAPWVNPREATNQGMSVEEYAKDQARLWEKGLGDWGQGKERIARLRDSVDMAIYTPGSNAGIPVSVLKSFNAPDQALREDSDLYRERIGSTATSILALLDIDSDPLTSREHILVANILQHAWDAGHNLDIAALIAAIQNPPMQRVGVVDIESFYPAKDRFALAMRLNNLLAAPGFEVWMQGEALNAERMLYTVHGKPRLSVLSIAHLSDSERMFFVTMLLNELISWMRRQSGTGSLRAILYMDEIFGYMPPTANPPSKMLFLSLLKQARAFGLGLVLATQNPVDLDYKGLSNTGTWFIGRLQTERDKARVMEGLEGASAGGSFDRGRMERILAGLGKRRFLLHNVHESAPVIFATRWVMSYLAGPMTRDQIKMVMAGRGEIPVEAASERQITASQAVAHSAPPVLPPKVPVHYLPATAQTATDMTLYYHPQLIAAASVHYHNTRYKVDNQREFLILADIDDGPAGIDFGGAEHCDMALARLGNQGVEGAVFGEIPPVAGRVASYTGWEKDFKRWLRTECPQILYRCAQFKLVSEPGESVGAFRVRLQQAANEQRDVAAGKLRTRYESKLRVLEARLQRAQQRVETEEEEASQGKLDTAITFGTAILGAFLGRKRVTSGTATGVGSAIKKARKASKQAGDIARAKEIMDRIQTDVDDLNKAFEADVEQLESTFDASSTELEELPVRARAMDIKVHVVGLAWVPFHRDAAGQSIAAYH
jgi:hypothetical protein